MLWTGVARDAERVTSSLRAEAFERLARIAAMRGDWVTARALIGEAVQLPLDSNERRQLDAESFALAHTGPAGDRAARLLLARREPDRPPTWALLATLAEPELGFAHYLLGLQHRAQKHWDLRRRGARSRTRPGPARVRRSSATPRASSRSPATAPAIAAASTTRSPRCRARACRPSITCSRRTGPRGSRSTPGAYEATSPRGTASAGRPTRGGAGSGRACRDAGLAQHVRRS